MLKDFRRRVLLSCKLLLGCVGLFAMVACSAKQHTEPEADPASTRPEVHKIIFSGNSTFSAAALRQAMTTTQRPTLPPWKRGTPYNRLTLEADLQRLKVMFFGTSAPPSRAWHVPVMMRWARQQSRLTRWSDPKCSQIRPLQPVVPDPS